LTSKSMKAKFPRRKREIAQFRGGKGEKIVPPWQEKKAKDRQNGGKFGSSLYGERKKLIRESLLKKKKKRTQANDTKLGSKARCQTQRKS